MSLYHLSSSFFSFVFKADKNLLGTSSLLQFKMEDKIMCSSLVKIEGKFGLKTFPSNHLRNLGIGDKVANVVKDGNSLDKVSTTLLMSRFPKSTPLNPFCVAVILKTKKTFLI